MQALYTFSSVFTVSWLLFHTLFHSLDITAATFANHLSISMLRDRLLVMVEPRYVKIFIASSKILSMLTVSGTCISWPMMLGFLEADSQLNLSASICKPVDQLL